MTAPQEKKCLVFNTMCLSYFLHHLREQINGQDSSSTSFWSFEFPLSPVDSVCLDFNFPILDLFAYLCIRIPDFCFLGS